MAIEPMKEPIDFKKGQTFSFLALVPDAIPDNYLETWIPRVFIRKYKNTSSSGFIAEIACYYADDTERTLTFWHNETDKWPIGRAELDVVFTSPTGYTAATQTVQFHILSGVTP